MCFTNVICDYGIVHFYFHSQKTQKSQYNFIGGFFIPAAWIVPNRYGMASPGCLPAQLSALFLCPSLDSSFHPQNWIPFVRFAAFAQPLKRLSLYDASFTPMTSCFMLLRFLRLLRDHLSNKKRRHGKPSRNKVLNHLPCLHPAKF